MVDAELQARFNMLVPHPPADIDTTYEPEPPAKRLPSWYAEDAAIKHARTVKADAVQAYRELAAAEALAKERTEKLQTALDTLEAAKLLYDLAWHRIIVDYPEITQKAWI